MNFPISGRANEDRELVRLENVLLLLDKDTVDETNHSEEELLEEVSI